jgi:hypothetical protein
LLAFDVPSPALAADTSEAQTQTAAADELAQARTTLREQYAEQLRKLAASYQAAGLSEPAKTVGTWFVADDPLGFTFHTLPTAVTPASAADEPWPGKFQSLRKQQAEALFGLAKRAAVARSASLAMQLVAEAAYENPDHEAARRVLGYQRYEQSWLTSFEVSRARENKVWSDRFGWQTSERLRRYEAGERYHRSRWISAAEDAAAHRDISQPWTILTDHYEVRTDRSLEEGVQQAAKLERLYRIWRQLFIGFYASEGQVARWVQGATPEPRDSKRHIIVYFRDRAEYNATLLPREPRIAVTTGYYHTGDKIGYFYAGADEGDENLYHEATHQLFAETRRHPDLFAQKANFWVLEGVACYMESLAERDGAWHVGGADAIRLREARMRLLRDNTYRPLAEFVELNLDRWKASTKLPEVYAQACGLVYFLMHASGGRYRETLVDYLASVYAGDDRPALLAELTGVGYSELDREYREFMQRLAPPRRPAP